MLNSDIIRQVAEWFFLSGAVGIILLSPLVDWQKTGVGLLKLLEGFSLAFLTISLISSPNHFDIQLGDKINVTAVLTAMLFGLHAFLYINTPDKNKYYPIFQKIKMVLMIFLPILLFQEQLPEVIFFILGAGFLGAHLFGLILGHWYLVVPKLSERPLLQVIKVLWAFAFFKLVGFIVFFDGEWFANEIMQKLTSFTTMMVIMRFVWGHFVVLFLSVMAWKLTKMRSLQSATGVLYAMVILTLSSELIAGYYFFSKGIFLG